MSIARLNKVVKEIYKTLPPKTVDFALIYAHVVKYELTIDSIGELATAIHIIEENDWMSDMHDMETEEYIALAVCNEAMKEFVEHTPMRGGIIRQSIDINEWVDTLYARPNNFKYEVNE